MNSYLWHASSCMLRSFGNNVKCQGSASVSGKIDFHEVARCRRNRPSQNWYVARRWSVRGALYDTDVSFPLKADEVVACNVALWENTAGAASGGAIGSGISVARVRVRGGIASGYTADAAARTNTSTVRTHIPIAAAARVGGANVLWAEGGSRRGPHAHRRPPEALPHRSRMLNIPARWPLLRLTEKQIEITA